MPKLSETLSPQALATWGSASDSHLQKLQPFQKVALASCPSSRPQARPTGYIWAWEGLEGVEGWKKREISSTLWNPWTYCEVVVKLGSKLYERDMCMDVWVDAARYDGMNMCAILYPKQWAAMKCLQTISCYASFCFWWPLCKLLWTPTPFFSPHQLLAFRPKNLKLLDVECALLTFLVIDTVAWFSAISPAARTQHITEEGTVVDLTKRFLRLPKWLVHHHHHCFLFKWSLNALSEVKMKWSACEKADIAKFWGMYHLKQYSKVVKWVELMSWMESPYVSFPS